MSTFGELIRLYLTTGSDDLRGGNYAFITFNLKDGTSTNEQVIGSGFEHDSAIEKDLPIAYMDLSTIKSITIRHDGSPRPGNIFDTYDNWDLLSLKVLGITENGEEINIYNSAFDRRRNRFVHRFTGASRQLTLIKNTRAKYSSPSI